MRVSDRDWRIASFYIAGRLGLSQIKLRLQHLCSSPAILLSLFQRDWNNAEKIKLHLKGTDFQLKVWQALLQIPSGRLSTYGTMAAQLGNPKAARAVGTAIGDNPVAYIIPCHRVIQSGGQPGGYHWGISRKNAIIGWESALSASEEE